ncbi:site-specific integrase [Burkholderia cenocepacia]|uniref:site-specific integrase n=1 Tax=Burkholderia cenocepacia TaxID=95486 RepID=UPI0009E0F44A|nr:site-specific integrase [Burkholderia cenocepacia]ARF89621.1 integrase [Burkholderia cenocepacia]MCW3678282.1 site-specific integrase [Burkholderia cenocepacia]MDC6086093.1 site-specific integrase [Burkholderia cenocepacia]
MKTLATLLSELEIPPLPTKIRSHRHGVDVDSSGEIWLVDQKRLDWRDVNRVHPLLLYLLKLFFAALVEQKLSDTVHKNFRRIVSVCGADVCFERWEDVDDERLASVLEISIMRALREKSKSLARQIRTAFLSFYEFIEQFDVPFYRSEFHARLADMYFKSDVVHKSVMTLDPEKGPLSRLDEYTLIAKLALEGQQVRDAAILSILHAWGLRPRQVSLLNIDDLIVTINGDWKIYTLRVPRIKQHVGKVGEDFRLRKLTPEVGERLHAVQLQRIEEVRRRGERQPPMFVARHVSGSAGQRLTAGGIGAVVKNFVETHRIISPVTGKALSLNPRRLRETFGTRCAEMKGMTKELLAEMLDHSSTRSLDVYFDFRESIANEIGALVGARKGYGTLRDVTERFAGLKRSEAAPLRTELPIRFLADLGDATDPRSASLRFVPPELTDANLQAIPSLGACGGKFRCGIAPLATCYGCSDFEPWIEGDHELIARWLGELCENAKLSGAKDDAEEFGLLRTKAEYIAFRARELRAAKQG